MNGTGIIDPCIITIIQYSNTPGKAFPSPVKFPDFFLTTDSSKFSRQAFTDLMPVDVYSTYCVQSMSQYTCLYSPQFVHIRYRTAG